MFSSPTITSAQNNYKFPIIYSEAFLEHDTGTYHPEKAGRLTAIVEALKNSAIAEQLIWQEPTDIHSRKQSGIDILQEVQRFHTKAYIDSLQAMTMMGGGYIDGDTIASVNTYDVALLAVSAWLDGVDLVLESGRPAFVLARPPGHHARAHTGMGFCIFGNAAIAAMSACDRKNLDRVAILDWDVHHGNGTQEAVWERHDIAYVSTHQSPFYPMTGHPDETGAHRNILNIPMRSGAAIAEYLPVFTNQIIPFLQDFQPDLLIVSAGFDANADDPLASIFLKPEDFGTFTQLCLEITPKIVFGLEGGYDFDSLSQSVVAVVEQCLKK
ncbi:histone deacetylase family protein [Pseudanabaena mucicola]|uniref:Histone deacetylase n=1 Tax=Pseudanabaena mucicola FACHB-723 TaxID=2692860 RepID=A0ABR7ZY72_9CYAN|nr:histone deacetylase [Pseudanabaena mucicola]MBD2188812.1 histone deacetylase [Pseudanabaena mucicola FACHB-723]